MVINAQTAAVSPTKRDNWWKMSLPMSTRNRKRGLELRVSGETVQREPCKHATVAENVADYNEDGGGNKSEDYSTEEELASRKTTTRETAQRAQLEIARRRNGEEEKNNAAANVKGGRTVGGRRTHDFMRDRSMPVTPPVTHTVPVCHAL